MKKWLYCIFILLLLFTTNSNAVNVYSLSTFPPNSGSTVTEELSHDAWGRLHNPETQSAYLPRGTTENWGKIWR